MIKYKYTVKNEDDGKEIEIKSSRNPDILLDNSGSNEAFEALLDFTFEVREIMGFDAFFSVYYKNQYITSSEL